jgi:hypothetical protein
MPRNSQSRSPIRSSSHSNYHHSKERHNEKREKRSYLPEEGRDNNFNRTKRIKTSRSHSRSYSPKRKKSKSKSKHKKHKKHHSSSKDDDYSTDTTNSTNHSSNTSKSSSRYYHKSKSKKKKHKKRKKHKKHEEQDEEELRLIQEVKEWQQKLRIKKDPAKISSSTIQHHKEEVEIEQKQKRPSMIPQTQKEYEAEQSVIREVVDPVDGRVR